MGKSDVGSSFTFSIALCLISVKTVELEYVEPFFLFNLWYKHQGKFNDDRNFNKPGFYFKTGNSPKFFLAWDVQ